LERSKEYRYIELFNDLVEALNAEAEDVTSPLYGKKIPVLMMAYGNLKDPPPEGESNIQPHDDIILLFTPWGRDYKQPFYSSVFDGQLLKWKDYFEQSETGASLGLHTKYARHLLLGYHLLPLDIIPIDFLYFGNVGVEYIELHSGYEGWWTKGLTLFACAKAFWNTGLDLSWSINIVGMLSSKISRSAPLFHTIFYLEILHMWKISFLSFTRSYLPVICPESLYMAML
jgi:hypothetical protein